MARWLCWPGSLWAFGVLWAGCWAGWCMPCLASWASAGRLAWSTSRCVFLRGRWRSENACCASTAFGWRNPRWIAFGYGMAAKPCCASACGSMATGSRWCRTRPPCCLPRTLSAWMPVPCSCCPVCTTGPVSPFTRPSATRHLTAGFAVAGGALPMACLCGAPTASSPW